MKPWIVTGAMFTLGGLGLATGIACALYLRLQDCCAWHPRIDLDELTS